MASCTQIENMAQAYIDGELTDSQRVIFEQHLAECPACQALFKRQQRASATLFEVLQSDRLDGTMRRDIIENLPEITLEKNQALAEVNWRAKHPRERTNLLMRRIPIALAFVLLALAIVIRILWYGEEPDGDAIGVVTYVRGNPQCAPPDQTTTHDARLKDFIAPGDIFQTPENSQLMLSLLGPTQIKLNADARLRVLGHRRVAIEKGEVWFDVGRDGRLFRATTPSGNIAVFGTSFLVDVETDATTVTVADGEIQLDGQEPNKDFVLLTRGRQSCVRLHEGPSPPTTVDPEQVTAWAQSIFPDKDAHGLFLQAILPRGNALEIPAERVFLVSTTQGGQQWAISAIRLYWEPDPNGPRQRCSYDVYVYDNNMTPLFKDHVEGTVFTQEDRDYCELPIPGGPISRVSALTIRLTPDYSTGHVETPLSVRALGL